MIRITTTIAEFNEQLLAKAQELNVALVGTINRLSEKFILLVHGGSSPASDTHRKKGWLANSVRPLPAVVAGTSVEGGVEAAGGAAWYGRLFEDGTSSPYTISPATAKFLKFELSGELLFRKSVQHPPFDGGKLAFMKPTAAKLRPQAETDVMATVMEILNS